MPSFRLHGPKKRLSRTSLALVTCALSVSALPVADGAAAPAVPPSAGLVAAYGFEGSSGTTVADSSGAGNAGETNATSTPAGRFGRALAFDGRSQRVDVRDDLSLDLTAAVTIEAWVRPTAAGGWRTAVVKEARNVPAYGLYARTPRGAARSEVVAGRARLAARSARVPLNAWTHLAATYDGSALRIFVNGHRVSATSASGPLAVTRGKLRIGGSTLGREWFAGSIDEVRIYSRALSRPEIVRDMGTPVVQGSTPSPARKRSAPAPLATPVAAPPAAPPAETAPLSATGLQFGYVANADIDRALDSTSRAGGRLARVEFAIGASVSDLRPYVEAARLRGIELILLAGFDHRIPSAAEAVNLGNWAREFGPGGTYWAGRSDASLASRFIEFGNETSYSYQGVSDRGGEYALRFRDAFGAVHAANARVGLLAQADDANTGTSRWVDAMYAAVPDLHRMVSGWTVHPYGPRERWEARLNRLVDQTAARGAPATIPIDVTEWGLATDDGRTLSDNYGWTKNMTYGQAATAVAQTVPAMLAMPRVGPRLRLFTYFQAHDQKPSGASGDREHYFGALRNDLSDKGPLTAALRALAAQYPAH